jgi:hypothetical protein
VGGSIASSVFGEPRQTVDADLVARVLPRHAEPLAARLSVGFYADLMSIRPAIESQGCFSQIWAFVTVTVQTGVGEVLGVGPATVFQSDHMIHLKGKF